MSLLDVSEQKAEFSGILLVCILLDFFKLIQNILSSSESPSTGLAEGNGAGFGWFHVSLVLQRLGNKEHYKFSWLELNLGSAQNLIDFKYELEFKSEKCVVEEG